MIKTILTTAAIALTTVPVFAETTQSTKATPSASSFSSLSVPSTPPPAMALHALDVPSAIVCRTRARAKYFELGAKDLSNPESNAQWGTVGSMQAVVWCRGTQAIVSVAGGNYNSVAELRDELAKAF